VAIHALLSSLAWSAPADDARKIFERVTGSTPSSAQLSQMVALLNSGNVAGAVDVAMADRDFYRIGLKRLFTRMTNVDEDPDAPLNDFSATLIGMVRDNKDFRRALFGDEYYVQPMPTEITGSVLGPSVSVSGKTLRFRINGGNCSGTYPASDFSGSTPVHPPNSCELAFAAGTAPMTAAQIRDAVNALAPGVASVTGDNRLRLADPRGLEVVSGDPFVGLAASERSWFSADNEHYEDIENRNLNLSSPSILKPASQLDYVLSPTRTRQIRPQGMAASPYVDPGQNMAPAGIFTTRANGLAFYSMGTNRRMVKFTLQNFMCRSLESLKDFTVSDYRVRRDVSRSPGGNSTEYASYCVGCHAQMDGLAGAFAKLDYVAQTLRVKAVANNSIDKNNQNSSVYPDGATVTDDSWVNLLAGGVNASSLGWRGSAHSGSGPTALGEALANSEQFSRCQVIQVFRQMCKREPTPVDDTKLATIATAFETEGFNLKTIFRKVAQACLL